jgi:transposase
MDLTDELWEVLQLLIPRPPCTEDGRGQTLEGPTRCPERHPLDTSHRRSLEGPPGALPTLPDTCHRRFQRWVEEGILSRILEALAQDLKERGEIDLSECYIDGTFMVAKKGESAWERPSGAKVRRSWRWQTVLVFLSPSLRTECFSTRGHPC